MKVELDEKGVLIVSGESPVESFALTHWHRLWLAKESLFLVQTLERDTENVMSKGFEPVDHQSS